MLLACSSCPGLVPQSVDACPHCGAPRDTREGSAGSALKRLAAVATGGAAMMSLMACYGYIDDGYYPPDQCSSDADCPSGQTCDTWTGSCQSPTTSTGTGFESACSDSQDDDYDGLVDCEDPDCAMDEACLSPEVCQNGLDDDKDGYLDCEDSDCPPCPATETWCGNLLDDDLDGLLDCEDPDCAEACGLVECGDGLQTGPEECDDGGVVDGDGCSATCKLELDVFCATLPPLVLGSSLGSNADGTNGLGSSCITAGGREVAYEFTALEGGILTVGVTSSAGIGFFVLDGCGGGVPELGCSTSGVEAGVSLDAGQTVTVVVDGASPADVGDFTLDATFVPNGT